MNITKNTKGLAPSQNKKPSRSRTRKPLGKQVRAYDITLPPDRPIRIRYREFRGVRIALADLCFAGAFTFRLKGRQFIVVSSSLAKWRRTTVIRTLLKNPPKYEVHETEFDQWNTNIGIGVGTFVTLSDMEGQNA